MSTREEGSLVHVGSLAALAEKGRQLVKLGAKQIVLFHSGGRVYACNNRCPHEGYPLKEGSLSQGCVLTCNWHNWKFDLESGDTLVGGDKLRRYPVRLIDDDIWLDVADPPPAERAAAALANLQDSFRRHEYDRMAREISRLQLAGADPLDAVRGAIHWTHAQLEFGTTHAHAAAPDWLALYDQHPDDASARLVCLLEIVGNLAWDTLREPPYPYPSDVLPFEPAALVEAIEHEDEVAAVGRLRGAMAEGLSFADLERSLAEAALAHYQDFGHSLIYVLKTGQLIERLGDSVAEPLLLALVRSLIFARREDLIPEFRSYREVLATWDGHGHKAPIVEDFTGLSVPRVLARTAESSADPDALFHVLLDAAAWQFLQFDLTRPARTDGPVSQNVGWLDVTHGITFANAVHMICAKYPELWPQGLLQIACFLGRNAGYIDRSLDTSEWAVADSKAFLKRGFAQLIDHAQPEYIVSCHLVKLLTAVREEITARPGAPWVPTLLAAANRFLNSPLKRKHTLRTARQAQDFVAAED